MPAFRADPPRVFITGASSGIGAALARAYAAGGAVMGLAARRGDVLDSLAGELPVPCRRYPLDVTDGDALAAAAEDFRIHAGCPDIVIANAGISVGTLTAEPGDLAVFERVMAVNVTGIANTFAPFLPAMTSLGRGTLVGIASVTGIRGIPGAGAYSASKAAAIAYLESLRVELRGTGVGVVTIAPGYIDTPMTRRNPYRMPFLLPADEAARRMLRVIERRAAFAVVPWQMGIVGKVLRWLPIPVFDRLFARAGRKPRGEGL